MEDALRLSDSYIQKCERLTSVAQLQNLQYHMTLNFTEQVEQARYFHSQSDLVADATSYIRHHLSESIRTEDIAKALFISRSHLSTTFKEDSGMNLSDYIHFIKISEAKHLLTHSDKSLLSISIYLGYSSQSHFCRIFKKYTGVSPKDYRLNH